MTEDELKHVIAKCDHNAGEHYMESCYDLTDDARELVAEVRRLRALIKDAESVSTDGGWPPGCPWCSAVMETQAGRSGHRARCPAFTESGDVR